ELHTTLTHPTGQPRRIADDERVVGNVPGHHRAGADKGVGANRVAAQHRAVGAETGAALDQRRPELIAARHVTARVDDVGEHHGRPAEDVVFERDPGVNRHVVLDLDVVTNHDLRRDDDVLAEVAAAADSRPAHDMAEVPDLGAVTNHGALVDEGGIVHKEVGHWYGRQ